MDIWQEIWCQCHCTVDVKSLRIVNRERGCSLHGEAACASGGVTDPCPCNYRMPAHDRPKPYGDA